jgi:hypothetical protein
LTVPVMTVRPLSACVAVATPLIGSEPMCPWNDTVSDDALT